MANGDADVIVTVADRSRERFDEAERGDATWFTLISGDITPTEGMSVGIAEFEAGGVGLALHRHDPPEIYHILGGQGVLTIEGRESAVAAGTTVFIPGNAEHGIRNAGADVLRLLYVFPTDRFSDVVYRFTPPA